MNTSKKKTKNEMIFCRTTNEVKQAIQFYAEQESRTFSSAVEYLIKKSLNL